MTMTEAARNKTARRNPRRALKSAVIHTLRRRKARSSLRAMKGLGQLLQSSQRFGVMRKVVDENSVGDLRARRVALEPIKQRVIDVVSPLEIGRRNHERRR